MPGPLRVLRPALVAAALVGAAACGTGTGAGPGRAGIPIERQTTSSTEAGDTSQGSPSDPAAIQALTIVEPRPGAAIDGNVVTIEPDVSGIEIAPADPADTSGTTGHYHVFVDRDPVPVGEAIPVGEPDILHTASDPIVLAGLSVGEHRLIVTVGDNSHVRISEELTAEVTVEVLGPSVTATAPAPVAAGQPVTLELATEGVEIAPAASGSGAHFHVFVDTDPPAAGEAIPTDDPAIIHTAETSVSVPDLAPGPHVIWVVLGDAGHVPLDPPVMARVTVTVT
jgi:hypothetical protein